MNTDLHSEERRFGSTAMDLATSDGEKFDLSKHLTTVMEASPSIGVRRRDGEEWKSTTSSTPVLGTPHVTLTWQMK